MCWDMAVKVRSSLMEHRVVYWERHKLITGQVGGGLLRGKHTKRMISEGQELEKVAVTFNTAESNGTKL